MSKKGFVTVVIVVGILFTVSMANGQDCPGTTLNFKDQSGDSSIKGFIDQLRIAVTGKNADFIRKAIHEKVAITYPEFDSAGKQTRGPVSGITNFMDRWNLQPTDTFWSIMEEILSMGGSFVNQDKTLYEAPYVHSEWPEDCHITGYGAIVGKNVIVRQSPDERAQKIVKLSDVIIKTVNFNPNEAGRDKWRKIITPNGREGYVPAKFVRSYYDYFVQFRKEGKEWKISFFAEDSGKRPFPPPRP